MKNKLKRKIYNEEYININGISQYLFHAGTDENNPVMLFLHGGPGSVESIFAYAFQEKWEEIYTVVHWDQRGAGKTLIKNPNSFPTVDLMLEDLYEVIHYLKIRYNKEKIILLGHSWGSVLGSTFVLNHPEDIEYYIGVGQVVNMIENESVGYEKVKELIIEADDKKSLKRLEIIGDYPGDKFENDTFLKIGKLRRLQNKYKLTISLDLKMISIVLKSPIMRFSDISAFIKSLIVNQTLYYFLWEYDLNSYSLDYRVPVYYILGENDWQTPYPIAQKYFESITAPDKEIYMIPNAGHMTMMDEPKLFYYALKEIYCRRMV